MFSDTRLAFSLMDSSCGPFAKARSNLAPASGFFSGLSTISDPAIARAADLPAAKAHAQRQHADEAAYRSVGRDIDAGCELGIVPGMMQEQLGEVALERVGRGLAPVEEGSLEQPGNRRHVFRTAGANEAHRMDREWFAGAPPIRPRK